MRNWGPNENLTLTDEEIALAQPIEAENGTAARIFCPFHGSDNQRSMRINLETGHFHCFNCDAWGYTEASRMRRNYRDRDLSECLGSDGDTDPFWSEWSPPPMRRAVQPVREDLELIQEYYCRQLPGSLGRKYLRERGVSLAIARRHRLGYAPPGSWVHLRRDTDQGRLVVPHTDPTGRIINLYGRAVDSARWVPKHLRHDHLRGNKGYFNARAIREGKGPLHICEGAFDALALIAAGFSRTIAIFGARGWRWEWSRKIKHFVFAFDGDAAGQEGWREIAVSTNALGRRVSYLPVAALAGHKDVSEAWVSGDLDLGPDLPRMKQRGAQAKQSVPVGDDLSKVKDSALEAVIQKARTMDDPTATLELPENIRAWPRHLKEEYEESCARLEFFCGKSRQNAESQAEYELRSEWRAKRYSKDE